MINETQDPSIVSLVNKILIKALASKVSEIHLEPQEQGLKVRFRQEDGVLRSASELLPAKIMTAVINRLKLMAELDIHLRHLPQDGKMQKVLQRQTVDFWVSTQPTPYGEKVLMRLLNQSVGLSALEDLISDAATLQMVKDMVNRPSGLLLVTGPAHSGKATTLSALISQRNQPGINISTVEEQIHACLPGVTQVEVNRDQGMDYDAILNSLLFQDVDIILVDQIRERKIANTVAEASLKGHLVLTSLASNDSVSAITHLKEMGVESSLISDTLIGILNQRFIRRVCPVCRLPHTPSQAELARFNLSQTKQATFYQANTLTPDALEQAKATGKLCSTCHGTGYQGEIGIYEVLRLTNRLKALITQNADPEILKTVALEEGIKTLFAYACALVTQGQTTLAEIEQMFPHKLMFVPSHSNTTMTPPSTNLSERLQIMERLLAALTQEFQELKQALEPTQMTNSLTPSDTLISEAIEEESLNKELNSEQQTLIADAFMYEELSDPGTWGDLKKELEANKQTITADFPTTEELAIAQSKPTQQKIPDPWS